MPDPHFYNRAGPFTLRELAELPDVELAEHVDPDILIHDVKPLDQAGEGDITFLSNPKYVDAFRTTRASACIAARKMIDIMPKGMSLLIANDPYKAYARVAAKFYPPASSSGQIHPTAIIAPSAVLGANVAVGPYTVIGERVEIGDETVVGPHVVINEGVRLGAHCRVGPSVSLSYCFIGDHVTLYAGVRIGEDGFGFAPDPAGHVKIPQLGRVIIGSHVEIGANTTIDRGAGPDTRIGDNSWIDNLVQIGHNVSIGKGVIIASQTGVSGSTVIEDYVVIGGQVGLAGHIRIGKGAQITAKSGVISDIPTGQVYAGYPARPRKQFFRQMAILGKLAKGKGSTND